MSKCRVAIEAKTHRQLRIINTFRSNTFNKSAKKKWIN
uniref:Uncharacterized protein n=1 Tax=Arundo donax TaxID=35708 RepID=A0A0A9AD02_ARUDO